MSKLATRLFSAFAITFAASIALTGCAPKAPTEGIILGKNFEPAHDEVYQVSVQSYDYGCRNVSFIDEDGYYDSEYVCEYYYGDHGKKEDRVRHVPDYWSILFEGYNSENELQKRTVSVSQAHYDQAKEGYFIQIVEDDVFISAR